MRFLTRTALAPYKPTIPRRVGAGLVGTLWAGVGTMLLVRASLWEISLPWGLATGLAVGALALVLPAWHYGFRHVAQVNTRRIRSLPASICAFAIQPLRGWLMVGVMMPLGIVLRHSPISPAWLVMPYAVMGSMLLRGSFSFFAVARKG